MCIRDRGLPRMEGNLTAADATDATKKKSKPARRRNEDELFMSGRLGLSWGEIEVWANFIFSASTHAMSGTKISCGHNER